MANNPMAGSVSENFTKFPCLPAEIRHQIWRYLLPGPRVIHIMGPARPIGEPCFVDATENPLLLRVCQESRAITCERYQLSFESYLRYPIYFDFSSDILLMQNDQVLSMFFERSNRSISSEVTRIKAIAVGLRPLPQAAAMHVVSHFLFVVGLSYALAHAASRFGNLREITLLTNGGQTGPGLENSLSSVLFREKMEKAYKDERDPYAQNRREFLKDEDGSMPIIKFMTEVDFWNHFS
ncbi:hypothetical protein L207DRAFT_508491 [Hyaloscypha variabilis F]|uniref:2EXR domain-containing protein n=1 Tax=Hyaloscypha variabilis (strain UAMH 11265 / GT02V1 / F) TaxID=1149755 RepID=A0A2J6S4J5_HYAVF|nr:hypothetical protein L207DRAFT_508491 [Hyaloscypha variabilis F]